LLAGGRIYGIEIQDYHLDFFGLDVPGLIAALRPLGFSRFVVLDRQDQLRKVVSHLIALDRKAHHIGPGDKAQGGKIGIVTDRVYVGHRFRTLADVLKSYAAFLGAVRAQLAHDDVLELDYETHVENDPYDAYRRMCDWIGIGKTAAQPLREMVANYDEMQAYLVAADMDPADKRSAMRAGG
jgi:LPS sulfotransferase NodH